MAITSAICDSFVKEAFQKLHDIDSGGDTLKLALIKETPTGSYDEDTTNYSDVTGNSDEASGTGYSAGGFALTPNAIAIDSNVIVMDFADLAPSGLTLTADGFIVYNVTASNAAIFVMDFGGTKTLSNGTLTITWPAPTAAAGILRFA